MWKIQCNQLSRWEVFGRRQRQKKLSSKTLWRRARTRKAHVCLWIQTRKTNHLHVFPLSGDWTDSFGDRSSLISRFERDNLRVGMYRPWGRDRAPGRVIRHVLCAWCVSLFLCNVEFKKLIFMAFLTTSYKFLWPFFIAGIIVYKFVNWIHYIKCYTNYWCSNMYFFNPYWLSIGIFLWETGLK